MTTIITGLLDAATWDLIFGTTFFFGLFFFLLVIFGSFGDDGEDLDEGDMDADGFDSSGEALDLDGDGVPDGIDLDGDGTLDIEFDGDFGDTDFDFDTDGLEIDIDGDGVPDGLDLDGDGAMDVEFDTDFDADTDFDTDMDSDIDGDVDADGDIDGDSEFDKHVELNDTLDAETSEEEPVFQSKYKMGNVSSFLFFFGLTGWPVSDNLQDFHLALAIAVGLLASNLFAYFIANYTKTVVVPLKPIRRGDVAQVRYSVTPEKAGMITVIRRDGVVSTEMAKGAFPHDHFGKHEKGYIWDKKNGIFLITRGIQGQRDLNPDTKPSKKKAMDL